MIRTSIILTNPLTCISKPETAEKLLARINESPVKDQVISAILNSATAQQPSSNSSNSRGDRGTHGTDAQDEFSSDDADIPDTTQTPCPYLKLKRESPVVSPLQIMAAAFTTDMSPGHQCADSQTHVSPLPPIAQDSNPDTLDNRLLEYFCMLRAISEDIKLSIVG